MAASGSSLSDARTASRLDRMLATLTGARRAMQRAHERAATDAAALAECRLQLQQSGKARLSPTLHQAPLLASKQSHAGYRTAGWLAEA